VSVCVFLGPTLTVASAAAVLDATFLPPVKLGDVHRVVVQRRPRAIGIIDGYFQWAPAVWHKELLWAVDQGVHVFGAASMGALRAVELASFGVRGIGRIVDAYALGRLDGPDDDPFEDDDEVAVVHGPPESGYRGSSEAMVNIRCTLIRAAAEGVVADATRRVLTAAAKALFFPDRRWESLLERGRASGLPERELAALENWLPGGRVDQKRVDAVAMLQAMRDFIATDPPRAQALQPFERTTYWESAENAFRSADGLLAALRLDVAECERLGEDELRDWYFTHVARVPVPADLAGWAREVGYPDPGAFHREAFAVYLARAGSDGGLQ
jgi:hypothetical protein